MPNISDDFSWWANDSPVCVREQPAIAIYCNDHGEIVIRQHDYPDDDVYILVGRQNVPAVIKALAHEAGIDVSTGTAPPSQSKPTVSKSAERQRRYRKRHSERNGEADSDVTRDDAIDATCKGRDAPNLILIAEAE